MQVNARAGKGETFVIEADEYDRMFLGLKTAHCRGYQPRTRSPRLLPHLQRYVLRL